MKGIIAVVSILLITGCFDRGRDGGSTTPTNPITPPPTNPAEGTVLGTECEEYTLVSELADGNGGSYFERQEESTECGWEEPELVISLEQGQGDRFKPVVIEVSYSHFGEQLEWDYEITAGSAKRTESGLEITSDGNLGQHQITIQGEEYQYELIDEPVCETNRTEGGYPIGGVIDCEGLGQGADTDDYIYYGPEDTQVVYWDVIYFFGDRRAEQLPYDEAPPEYAETSFKYDLARKEIAYMNERLAQSGAFVEMRLVGVYGPLDRWSYDKRRWIDAGLLPRSDIIVNYTKSAGNCGFAGVGSKFRDSYAYYLVANAACGADTTLHEIGHAVGLHHGVNNSSQAACGRTFPAFACGKGNICNVAQDVMFYGPAAKYLGTPNKLCSEVFPEFKDKNRYGADETTGTLDFSATAYAINRVRYDVSLVHDEHKKVETAPIIRADDYEYPFPEVEGEIVYD